VDGEYRMTRAQASSLVAFLFLISVWAGVSAIALEGIGDVLRDILTVLEGTP
jgi:hypothetical protein